MTPEERFDRIEQTLDYVAMLQRSHDEQIAKLVYIRDLAQDVSGKDQNMLVVLPDALQNLTRQSVGTDCRSNENVRVEEYLHR